MVDSSFSISGSHFLPLFPNTSPIFFWLCPSFCCSLRLQFGNGHRGPTPVSMSHSWSRSRWLRGRQDFSGPCCLSCPFILVQSFVFSVSCVPGKLGIYGYCRTSWFRFDFPLLWGKTDNSKNRHTFFYGAIRQFKEIIHKQWRLYYP